MPRILVRPEALWSFGAEMQQAAQQLSRLAERLNSAWTRLDWEARHRTGVEGQVHDACGQAHAVANQTEAMAGFLARKARSFGEADQQGAKGVGQVLLAFLGTQRGRGDGAGWWDFPEGDVRLLWSLGGLSSPSPPAHAVHLPATGGMALVGLASLGHLPGTLEHWRERLWNWLHGYGWKTNADLATPERSEPGVGPARTGFGALLGDRARSDLTPARTGVEGTSPHGTVGVEGTPEATPGATPAAASPPSVTTPTESWWWEVPARSQQGLRLPSGVPSAYGCAPTATSMILDYWHARDPGNETMSAQDLLTANVQDGEFHAGMSPSDIHDEVEGLGYVLESHVGSNLDGLKEAVARGPVIAVVKLGMQASGVNHSVVVTGISPDGQVRVNDPWDGQVHTYPWEDFRRSWGAGFGQGAPKNSFVEIRPAPS